MNQQVTQVSMFSLPQSRLPDVTSTLHSIKSKQTINSQQSPLSLHTTLHQEKKKTYYDTINPQSPHGLDFTTTLEVDRFGDG